jgi:hypothetical protein
MPTRDLSNRRIAIALGLASAITDLSAPKASECNLLLNASPAIRWSNYDFNVTASDKVDDRSLDDEGAAQVRGYNNFGGGVPFFYPKVTDLASILRSVFNLVKQQNTQLAWIERVGFASSRAPFVAGDNVNAFLIATDSLKPDTAGSGGYAYVEQFLAQGKVYPWTILAPDTPVAVTTSGAATQALALTGTRVALRKATYLGNDVTRRAKWLSSNPAVATVEDGIIVGRSAGTANVTATFPGALASTAIAVTVS